MNKYIYQYQGSLYLNLTNRCSNACDFCIRNSHNGVSDKPVDAGEEDSLWLDKEPLAEEIIETLEKMDLSDYKEVIFCGFGEPVYKLQEILEIGKYLKSRGANTRINTNGQGNLIHNRDITKELCGVLDRINVSLNASNAEEYDRICHSEFGLSAYAGLLNFAEACLKNGVRVILSVVNSIPEEEIEKARKVAESINAEFRVRQFE